MRCTHRTSTSNPSTTKFHPQPRALCPKVYCASFEGAASGSPLASTFQRLPFTPSRFCPPRNRSTSFRSTSFNRHKTVLVAGGSGVALKTAQRLRNQSCPVYVLQRSDARAEEIQALGATMVQADVLERDQLSSLFSGLDGRLDVVVSSVGGTPADATADSVGNINLIDEALRKGVKKFVLITSIGVADSKDAVTPNVYEVLEPVLIEKAKAEEHLKSHADKMKYVIIRPGGLKNEPATGNAALTQDNTICGSIHREDVADLIAKCVFSEKTENIVLAAVDKAQVFGEKSFEEYIP